MFHPDVVKPATLGYGYPWQSRHASFLSNAIERNRTLPAEILNALRVVLNHSYQWGRVEHIVSGQVAHFKSLVELATFITQVLSSAAEASAPSAESHDP
jgi:hypothetical protein